MEITHEKLVEAGKRWLRPKCRVVLTEFRCGILEEPDVLGFGNRGTYMVECKASRDDFLADQKKTHRTHIEMSVGSLSWYLTPRDMIREDELPPQWGLAELRQSRHAAGYYIKVVREAEHRRLEDRQSLAVEHNEKKVLVSALWRSLEAVSMCGPLWLGEERNARDILQRGGFHEDMDCGSCHGPLEQSKTAVCDRCENELWAERAALMNRFKRENALGDHCGWSDQETAAWNAYRRASWVKGKGEKDDGIEGETQS